MVWNDKDTLMWERSGYLNNTVLPLPSEGLYKTILSLPNLHLVTTGHYHENDYCCSTENKLLCQGTDYELHNFSLCFNSSVSLKFKFTRSYHCELPHRLMTTYISICRWFNMFKWAITYIYRMGFDRFSPLLGRHSGYGGYSDIARGSRIIQLEKDKLQTWIRMENRNIVDHIILKYHNFAIQES